MTIPQNTFADHLLKVATRASTGAIIGNRATAEYRFRGMGGCLESWQARLDLARGGKVVASCPTRATRARSSSRR